MSVPPPTPPGAALDVVLAVMTLAIAIALVRLIVGPTLADRVVALDLIGALAAGTIAATAIHSGAPALLDAAVVVGLVAFVGTVALARHVERGASGR